MDPNTIEKATATINDNLLVMAEIQRRQSEQAKAHAEWLSEHEKSMTGHRARMDRIDVILAEIADKLNGLIGYLDGQRPQAKG